MVTSAMVLFLAVASNVFGAIFTKLGTASLITNTLVALPLSDWWKLALIMVIIFILGWPFEWPAIILVFLPIVLPVVEKLQLRPRQARPADLVRRAHRGQPADRLPQSTRGHVRLLPANVVPQWSLSTIYKGMADYMVIQVFVLFLLLLYPQIALWLPSVVR